jgi:hypothetical protein
MVAEAPARPGNPGNPKVLAAWEKDDVPPACHEPLVVMGQAPDAAPELTASGPVT